MKKRNILLTTSALLIFLTWCWKQESSVIIWEDIKNNKYSQEYIVDENAISNINLYAIVESDSTKNVISTRWWTITKLNCQAWKQVKAWDTIAIISPDTSDPNYQNLQVQKIFLQWQLDNLNSTLISTISNFDSQKKNYETQRANNLNQIDILNQNFNNLKKQKELSSGDINIRIESAQEQLDNLKISYTLTEKNKTETLNKIDTNISNIKKQIKVTWTSNLNTIDQIFWITQENRTKNDAFENYLSAKDLSQKEEVQKDFYNVSKKFDNFDNMNNQEISSFLIDISNLLKISADAVNASISSSSFTETTISTYYSSFNSWASWFLTYKTNFDDLVNTYQTTQTSYDTQLTTINSNIQSAQKTLENLKNNTSSSSDISYDSSINSLNLQIQSLEYANENIEENLVSLDKNKEIQVNQINNQILSMKQNIETLKINTSWETLYAWVNWTIKTKKVDENNKISSSTIVCQISTKDKWNYKLKIYSPDKLPLWTEFIYYKNWNELGTWAIEYEVPFKDQTTQNYIYENNINNSNITEWDRIDIKLNIQRNENNIWIPLDFIAPKIDWYYVIKKTDNNYSTYKVEIWNMDSNSIQVLSWLNAGDILVK